MERSGRTSSNAQIAVWSHDTSRLPALVEHEASWLALVGNPTRRDLARLSPSGAARTLLDECRKTGTAGLAASVSRPFAAALFHGTRRELEVAGERTELERGSQRAL